LLVLTAQVALAAFPKITGYAPVRGAPGTVVTITGQNFGGLTDVLFGNIKAAVQTASASQLRVIVPGDALSGPISVFTARGQDSSQSLTIPYFQVAPRVADFYREFGPDGEPVIPAKALIGDRIYLRGANFDDPNRPASPDYGLAVFVNGVRATQGAVTSPANIQFIVPPGAGTGPITITNFAGSATSAQLLYFQPVISAYTACAASDDTINLYGSNFTGVTDVRFGTIPATSFTIKSGTNIEAVVPPNAVNGPLSLTAPGGAFITTSEFRVLPLITGFTPAGGDIGTVVTITGAALSGTTAVRFGGVGTLLFTNLSATRLSAVVPAAAVSGPITVVTANGTNASIASFYLAPVVLSFNPSQGPPGTMVRLTGRNFADATGLKLGTNAITGFTVDSNTQITFTLPPGLKTGTLSVSGPGGTAGSGTAFRVTGNEPTITGFSPSFGAVGTQVTIRGARLASITNVTFAGVKALFSAPNGKDLVALVPTGAATGPITVISADGSATSTTDFYLGTTADLRTTLTVSENPPAAFGPLTCTWRLTNLGPVPSNNTVGKLILPAGLSYFDAVVNRPFTLNGNELQVTVGVLDPGETVILILRTLVGAPGAIPLQASITSSIADNNVGNNSVALSLNAQTPRLFLEPLPSGQLLLTWSAAGTNYVAERQAQLGEATWLPVSGTPTNDGATLQLAVLNGPGGFFRIRQVDGL
jgi:hypothetical protein